MNNQTYENIHKNIKFIDERIPEYLTHANHVHNVSDRIANLIHGLATEPDIDKLFKALDRLVYTWGEALESLHECGEDISFLYSEQRQILEDLLIASNLRLDRRAMCMLCEIYPYGKFRKWLMKLIIGKYHFRYYIELVREAAREMGHEADLD